MTFHFNTCSIRPSDPAKVQQVTFSPELDKLTLSVQGFLSQRSAWLRGDPLTCLPGLVGFVHFSNFFPLKSGRTSREVHPKIASPRTRSNSPGLLKFPAQNTHVDVTQNEQNHKRRVREAPAAPAHPHHKAGFRLGTRTYLEKRPAGWARHVSGLSPRSLRPFIPRPPPTRRRLPPPPQPAATYERPDWGAGEPQRSVRGGVQGIPESQRSGALALKKERGSWSTGAAGARVGGRVPGRAVSGGGAQGGQARGGALGFHPGWEGNRRRGGGGGAGAGQGRVRGGAKLLRAPLLALPARAPRSALLAGKAAPAAAALAAPAPARCPRTAGGLRSPLPAAARAGWRLSPTACPRPRAAWPVWPFPGAPLSYPWLPFGAGWGTQLWLSSPVAPAGREPGYPRPSCAPGNRAAGAHTDVPSPERGEWRVALGKWQGAAAAAAPTSLAGALKRTLRAAPGPQAHEERASHLVRDPRPVPAWPCPQPRPCRVLAETRGAAVVGGRVASVSGRVNPQALGGGQPVAVCTGLGLPSVRGTHS